MSDEEAKKEEDEEFMDLCEYYDSSEAQEEHSRRFHARNGNEAGGLKGRTQELKDLGVDPDTLRRY